MWINCMMVKWYNLGKSYQRLERLGVIHFIGLLFLYLIIII
jgi:hypothetical protein